MDKLVYGATSRFTREIRWLEITLSLCVKQSSILDKYIFLMWLHLSFKVKSSIKTTFIVYVEPRFCFPRSTSTHIIRGAYNLVRIKPGDEWKTAFRTRYGHFEYMVMPFGLTNAPCFSTYDEWHLPRISIDQFVVIYLDNILIFSHDYIEYTKHIRLVLSKLREHGLYAKSEKCEFDRISVEFLEYVISSNGLTMDKMKVATVQEWEVPTRVKDVQSFLGFAKFYRRFIQGFSTLA